MGFRVAGSGMFGRDGRAWIRGVAVAAGALVALSGCETKTPVDSPSRDESATVTASETGDSSGPVAPAPTPTTDPTGEPVASAGTEASASPAPAPSGSAAVKGGVEELVPDPITHPCVVKTAQLEVALAGASGKCASNADCDCYPGGYSRKGGCGGVTDAQTAKKMHAIVAELASMSCPKNLHCGPRPCTPTCVDGRCK
jgi:hypothetical protein